MLDAETQNARSLEKAVKWNKQHLSNKTAMAPLVGSAGHRTSRRPSYSSLNSAELEERTDADNESTASSQNQVLSDVTNLSLGVFREVEWSNINLNGHDAHGADFRAAVLSGISALGANFADSLLEEAQLQNAALCGANFTGANLRHVNLRNANLTWADLRGATLFAADLRCANLAWADLRDADLRQVNLTGAIYNYQTQWPVDFDPSKHVLIALAEPR